MTGLEMGKGTITKSTTGGLWETRNRHARGSQTEKGSSLTPSGHMPTRCRMDTGMRPRPRDTAPHASKLDMNQKGQSCFCLAHALMVALNPQCFHFLVTLACCSLEPICPGTWATNQILLPTVLPDTFLLFPCLHSNGLNRIGPVQNNVSKGFSL